MTNTKYKIIKNYIKYIAYDDINYINKIIGLIDKNNIQIGGDKNGDISENSNITNYKKLNFVIDNIELIIKDVELFNRIINIIKNHDMLMSKINSKYKKFNYDENILTYLDKIYKDEFIYV